VSLFGYTDIMEPSKRAEKLTSRIVEILSTRRDELDMSLRQIEDKSGVNYMTVKRVLDGTRGMRVEDFQAIANALGLTASRIVKQAELDFEAGKLDTPASAESPTEPAGRAFEVCGLEPPSVDDVGIAAKRGSADPYEDVGGRIAGGAGRG
jgi:transcriptional regulator with XRE-family HTH domain